MISYNAATAKNSCGMKYDIGLLGVNFEVKIFSLSILHEIESLLYSREISHVQQKGEYLFL